MRYRKSSKFQRTFLSLVFVFNAVLLLVSCSGEYYPTGPSFTYNERTDFEFYLLEDSTITVRQAEAIGINDLILKNKPWLSHNDIALYDFSTHCIYLKQDKGDFFESSEYFDYVIKPQLMGKPFVVVAGSKRCYIGMFTTSTSQHRFPAIPYIEDFELIYYPDNIIHLANYDLDYDIREHPIIKEAIINLGLYHRGVQIELTSFQIIDNADTATAEYRIRITNQDRDDLYVFDPAKAGSDLLSRFTVGPTLIDTEKNERYSPVYRERHSTPLFEWSPEWYTLLRSGETLERVILQREYPHIPPGNYQVYVRLSTPINIESQNLYLDGERVWIGFTESEIKISL